ncbi:hypothetical protein N7460_010268 [Penicillium canescens]|uniref:AMP-dependent synthetase/ligase domain-containing protein n=1 Tax=Penicillium canescens TaxID=5083 RepID=A0AAD6I4E6_PENCN|nr:hypothetical protein N7460_010268 [Penicillium canescens]KAJ6060379.1 hypothetical protein N7444_002233 [Penicillium canescens]
MSDHWQSTVFPNEPIFKLLLEAAQENRHVAVSDSIRGVNASYAQLLVDICTMREEIRKLIPHSMFDARGLMPLEATCIFILGPASYLFILASFTALSLGGAIFPLSTGASPPDAYRLLQKARSSLILADPLYLNHALEIKKYADGEGTDLYVVPTTFNIASPGTLLKANVKINQDLMVEQTRPGLIISTSGTTGPPKLVVHGRGLFASGAHYQSGDVFLCHRSPVWFGGLWPLISVVLARAKLRIVARDASVIWESLRSDQITFLSTVPAVWTQLMEYYQSHISNLAHEQAEAYRQGVQKLRRAIVSSSSLLPSVQKFWADKMQRPLMVVYAATELGGAALVRAPAAFPDEARRIGKPPPGVLVKLSEGDHGQLLIKSPSAFLRYLGNPEATENAFDEDGYYKSDDFAHRVGDEYVLDGRIIDYIRYYGYKVMTHEVEARMAVLPYISEACVLAVPVANDAFTTERVGALVRLQSSHLPSNGPCWDCRSTLERLRADLSRDLAFHMLPTVLCLLHDSEQIPRTVSEKFNRRDAVERYFKPGSFDLPQDIKVWDFKCQNS